MPGEWREASGVEGRESVHGIQRQFHCGFNSRMAYLMGRNGEPIASLPVDLGIANGPAAVADDLAKLVK